jgi:predicted DsbA family dithiol-disulfide isomerase
MTSTFTIDVWSDVVCPFCYLGARQLDQAIARFEHREHVVVRRHAFELDPRAPIRSDLSLNEMLAKKYDMPVEHARALNERMADQARTYDMEWHLDRARPANTFNAHRLIALAASQGRDAAMSERLFRAYFSEGELISDCATLSSLAREVGVSGADDLWAGDLYADVVNDDERAAQELGITGVPAFLLDEKFMVLGAQGAEKLLDVLDRAWQRRSAA